MCERRHREPHDTIILLPGFTASSYIAAGSRYRAAVLTSVPTMIAMILRERFDRGSHRTRRWRGESRANSSLEIRFRPHFGILFPPSSRVRARTRASGEELERWQRRWEQSIGPSTGSYNRPGGFPREKHFPSGNACAARLMICGVSTSKAYKNASVSHTPAREFSVSSMASQRLSSSPNF